MPLFIMYQYSQCVVIFIKHAGPTLLQTIKMAFFKTLYSAVTDSGIENPPYEVVANHGVSNLDQHLPWTVEFI